VLDRYPTVPEQVARQVEKDIKRKLGLVHDATESKRTRFNKGLSECKDMDLRVGIGHAMNRHLRLHGYAGVHAVVAKVEKACLRNTKLRKSYWPSLYRTAALVFGRRGDCTLFEDYMQRYLKAGGSPRDLQGYRKNYTPCPAP
jgi:hypothetical protein